MKEHKLKKKLKRQGRTITWVAQQLNLKQSTLSMYLSGDREMPKDVELRITKLIA